MLIMIIIENNCNQLIMMIQMHKNKNTYNRKKKNRKRKIKIKRKINQMNLMNSVWGYV